MGLLRVCCSSCALHSARRTCTRARGPSEEVGQSEEIRDDGADGQGSGLSMICTIDSKPSPFAIKLYRGWCRVNCGKINLLGL
jgi:hypothetical protein